MKKCRVVLERIDVSSYVRSDVRQNVARESSSEEVEPTNPNEINSMEIECVDNNGVPNPSGVNSIEYADDSEEEIAAAEYVLFASCYLLTKMQNNNVNQRKERKVWVREWLRKRQEEGAYSKLLVELRNGDSGEQRLYRDFPRMTHRDFEHLLQLATPLIEKSNTRFRESIPPGERLALTLHYLATGSSFRSLQFLFRIPQSTISIIIPAVLDAIWTVLKDEYVRVSFQSIFSITFT